MNVKLAEDLERIIHQKLESGRYQSPEEIIREALVVLDERDTLDEIRREKLRGDVQAGIDQADRGEFSTATEEEMIERIRRRVEGQNEEAI